MKIIFLLFLLIYSGQLLLAQDTLDCPIQENAIPFEIHNDPNISISFPDNYFPKGVKGIAMAPVLVDEKGNLIKYCVNTIRIQDSTKTNSLLYADRNMTLESISGTSAEMPIDNYPYFVRFIVEEIYEKIKKTKFLSNKTVVQKKKYRFSVIFKIK